MQICGYKFIYYLGLGHQGWLTCIRSKHILTPFGKVVDPVDKWKHLGNEEAERVAKQVVLQHPLYPKLKTAFEAQVNLKKQLFAFHDYICDAVDETFRALQESKPKSDRNPNEVSFKSWFHHMGWTSCRNEGSLALRNCQFSVPWGRPLRVRTWLLNLQWPPTEEWWPQQ